MDSAALHPWLTIGCYFRDHGLRCTSSMANNRTVHSLELRERERKYKKGGLFLEVLIDKVLKVLFGIVAESNAHFISIEVFLQYINLGGYNG